MTWPAGWGSAGTTRFDGGCAADWRALLVPKHSPAGRRNCRDDAATVAPDLDESGATVKSGCEPSRSATLPGTAVFSAGRQPDPRRPAKATVALRLSSAWMTVKGTRRHPRNCAAVRDLWCGRFRRWRCTGRQDDSTRTALSGGVIAGHLMERQVDATRPLERHRRRRSGACGSERLYQSTPSRAPLASLLTVAGGVPALAGGSPAAWRPPGSANACDNWRRGYDGDSRRAAIDHGGRGSVRDTTAL